MTKKETNTKRRRQLIASVILGFALLIGIATYADDGSSASSTKTDAVQTNTKDQGRDVRAEISSSRTKAVPLNPRIETSQTLFLTRFASDQVKVIGSLGDTPEAQQQEVGRTLDLLDLQIRQKLARHGFHCQSVAAAPTGSEGVAIEGQLLQIGKGTDHLLVTIAVRVHATDGSVEYGEFTDGGVIGKVTDRLAERFSPGRTSSAPAKQTNNFATNSSSTGTKSDPAESQAHLSVVEPVQSSPAPVAIATPSTVAPGNPSAANSYAYLSWEYPLGNEVATPVRVQIEAAHVDFELKSGDKGTQKIVPGAYTLTISDAGKRAHWKAISMPIEIKPLTAPRLSVEFRVGNDKKSLVARIYDGETVVQEQVANLK